MATKLKDPTRQRRGKKQPKDTPASAEANGHAANGTVGTLGHSVKKVVGAALNGEKIVQAKAELPDQEEAWEKIRETSAECDTKERDFLVAKERASELKKDFESSKAQLRSIIRWANTPVIPGTTQKTLFDDADKAAKKKSTKPEPALSDTKPTGNPALDNLWRDYPLERWKQYDLPAGVIAALAEANVGTVGQLSDYTKPNANGFAQQLVDVKGIGKAKVDKISEAEVLFWADWAKKLQAEFAREKGIVTDGNETPAQVEPATEPAAGGDAKGEQVPLEKDNA